MNLFSSFVHKLRDNNITQWILFVFLGLVAFYKIFSFWFYRGWETSWLLGITGGDFSLLNLMKSHGLISYMNYLLFGWRPTGWFVTALILHITTAMVINFFISRKTNRTVGLVAGLFFLVTTAHHDVITWGSFESLYAAQTLCFYFGLWFFDIYQKTKKSLWYGGMIFWFVISLIIRESGLIFLPLLLVFDLIFHAQIFEKKPTLWVHSLFSVAKRHIPLWIVSGIYLFIRASYGGAGHDFIDERVQYRILLFHEHRYIEYIRYGLLSFGYFIGPYLIPYPLLNLIRDIVLHYGPNPFIKTYFFTFVGWVVYTIFCLVVYRLKNGRYGKYLLFCLFSFTVVTLFYSFAWTVKESFLESAYAWSENRWRYLGFTFFAAGAGIVLYSFTGFIVKKIKISKFKLSLLASTFLTLYFVVNIALLWRIQDQMYIQNSQPAVMFYKTFLKAFPTLTSEDRFYAFRASPLNDFLAELSYIYPSYYPNLKGIPSHWARFEMYYILKAMRQKESWASNIHFIDYSRDQGVKDYTAKTKTMIASLAPVDLSSSIGTDSAILIDTTRAHPVEFRYILTGSYQALSVPEDSFDPSETEKIQAVSAFSTSLASGMSDAHISVCLTMGDQYEPFHDLRKELALDGTISPRSYWWANCRPAWITLDMGTPRVFAGAGWASTTSLDSIPRDYRYDISDDGKNWKQVHEVKRNGQKSAIDVFDHEVSGRYIRLWVNETSYRQMLRIDEFFPLFPETVAVAKYFHDVPTLYNSMQYNSMQSQARGLVRWVKVMWTTNPDNTVPVADTTLYMPIYVDGESHQMHVELLESDFYSAAGQFLRRKLTHIRFELPKNVSFHLNNIQLTPQE